MFRPTERTYTNAKNGKQYTMYRNDETEALYMLNGQIGERIMSFVCAAHIDCQYKLSDGSIVSLKRGEFMPINAKNQPVARKMAIEKRFKKY